MDDSHRKTTSETSLCLGQRRGQLDCKVTGKKRDLNGTIRNLRTETNTMGETER